MGAPESRSVDGWKAEMKAIQRPWGTRWWTDAPELERAKWTYANACVRYLQSHGGPDKDAWRHITGTLTWEEKHNFVEYFKTLSEWAADKETGKRD